MTILALAFLAVSLQTQNMQGGCSPLDGVTAPPPGYRVDYRGALNGAPYPVILRNESLGGAGLNVRYHQGAGVSSDTIEMNRSVVVEAVGGVIAPLGVSGSSRSAERHWVYDGDPAIRVAALAEGETVSLTARDSDGATTTYTVRFVGCGVVQVGGVDERVNHYEVREGAESTGTGKIVSLSIENGWWLREDNPRTGLIMTATSIRTP